MIIHSRVCWCVRGLIVKPQNLHIWGCLFLTLIFSVVVIFHWVQFLTVTFSDPINWSCLSLSIACKPSTFRSLDWCTRNISGLMANKYHHTVLADDHTWTFPLTPPTCSKPYHRSLVPSRGGGSSVRTNGRFGFCLNTSCPGPSPGVSSSHIHCHLLSTGSQWGFGYASLRGRCSIGYKLQSFSP